MTPTVSRHATGAAALARSDVETGTIDSLTHDARGVARINGKATFIEGALPGEQVRFRYRHRRSRYDTATLVEVLESSPERVAPPCAYFGVCGGCSLQHLAPNAQLRAKQDALAETLKRFGRVEPQRWLPPIADSAPGYRRRARLGVRYVAVKGGVLVGFRERGRSYITPLADCLTLDPRLSVLLPGLRDAIAKLSRPDRVPQAEVSAGDDACAVVIRHLEPLTPADGDCLRAFAADHAVGIYLQPAGPQSVTALWPENGTQLTYALPAFDLTLAFGPSDFIQVNAAVNRALVERAVALLEPSADENVLDLFCGLGNFTLALARRGGRVAGYESDAALVARARENARANRVENAVFGIADLYGSDARLPWSEAHYEKLLLDPPRAGAMAAIKAIPRDRGPQRLVYVSCNPATLARDSEYLVHVLGYRLEAAGIADMFPHTSHTEAVALYVRQ